ncbi:hypothetical protein ABBQ38_011577 [Trebouxia sp. C0009 RCD-2024]
MFCEFGAGGRGLKVWWANPTCPSRLSLHCQQLAFWRGLALISFMTNHAFGRGTVAVPVKWIDSLVPHAQVILQAVRLRNRTRTGKADFSGQHCVESTLYLAETFWQSSPFMLQRYGLGW